MDGCFYYNFGEDFHIDCFGEDFHDYFVNFHQKDVFDWGPNVDILNFY